ncbi:MAG: hypothetical protein GY953_30970, partial [bacterium]|nr:hypothetical protein [bacterium]
VVRHPDEILTRTGILTIAGVLVVVIGVTACAVSGRIREKVSESERKGSLVAGLVISIASGVLAPMMNFGLSYGSEITNNARLAGAGEYDLVNAIWPVLLLGGFAANALYCAWLMARGSGWRTMIEVRPLVNIPLGLLMGLLWMGGLLMYGYASRMLGPLGLVLGWPITMGCTVLVANAWGIVTGEWTGAPKSAKLWVSAGVALLIGGVALISAASGQQVPQVDRVDFEALRSPIIFQGDDKLAYRDPAVVYHEGTFYLYFTLSEMAEDGGYYNMTALSKSRDLVEWSPPRSLTPRDRMLNHSSPGNVIRYEGKWIICLQTYPTPNLEQFGNNTSRIWIMRSDDL